MLLCYIACLGKVTYKIEKKKCFILQSTKNVFKIFKNFLFFISLMYFTATKCGNLSLNILELFQQKKKKVVTKEKFM